MKHDAIKRFCGRLVRIRPALQIYDDCAVLRSTIEEAWRVSEVTDRSFKLQGRDMRYEAVLGFDHIHSTMEDADGAGGVLVMNVQLLLYEGILRMEPVVPPGTPLKSFVPPRPREALFEAAARVRQQAAFEEASRRFLSSAEGVAAADEAFSEIPRIIEQLDRELEQAGHRVEMTMRESRNYVLLGAAGWWVSFAWERPYRNTLEGAALKVTQWDSHPAFPGMIVRQKARAMGLREYRYGLAALNQPRWLPLTDPSRSTATRELVQGVLTQLLQKPNQR